VSNTQAEQEDRFSPEEAAALASWRAPEPPAGFAERVLAEAAARPRAGGAATRGVAVAAVALLLVGGFFTVRTLLGHGPAAPVFDPAGAPRADAGARPEVRGPFDGVSGEAS
jgi:hypothetical protein